MPELPEVETTLRGIQPYIEKQIINQVSVRHHQLRWPIPADIENKLIGSQFITITRRAKYLLFSTAHGTLIIHLGMSGCLRILSNATPIQKHDHIDIVFANHMILRFTDPRRFGAFLWTEDPPKLHPLLKNLGPEPFDKNFSGKYLWQRAQNKKIPIKTFIMDNKNVVGVGNIYANEVLFCTGVHPLTPAGQLSIKTYHRLALAITAILGKAIKRGGTTLKDFLNSDGKPGYFSNYLNVYGRTGLPCVKCQSLLKTVRIAQRSTFFCEQCQHAAGTSNDCKIN